MQIRLVRGARPGDMGEDSRYDRVCKLQLLLFTHCSNLAPIYTPTTHLHIRILTCNMILFSNFEAVEMMNDDLTCVEIPTVMYGPSKHFAMKWFWNSNRGHTFMHAWPPLKDLNVNLAKDNICHKMFIFTTFFHIGQVLVFSTLKSWTF